MHSGKCSTFWQSFISVHYLACALAFLTWIGNKLRGSRMLMMEQAINLGLLDTELLIYRVF